MFPNKLFRNILKYSKLFPLEHFWQLSRTLWVVLKHFFSLRHFEMFTNLFGNFLNVKEHFEMFQWNNQKCFQTNSSENILKCSKLFFPNISGNYPEHCELFSNIFSLDTLKCFQTCSGTFWKVRMVHSEMFPNKLFRNLFSEHF